MITVWQINNGKKEKSKQTLLITYKFVVQAIAVNYSFHAEAGIVLKLSKNETRVLIKKKRIYAYTIQYTFVDIQSFFIPLN